MSAAAEASPQAWAAAGGALQVALASRPLPETSPLAAAAGLASIVRSLRVKNIALELELQRCDQPLKEIRAIPVSI